MLSYSDSDPNESFEDTLINGPVDDNVEVQNKLIEPDDEEIPPIAAVRPKETNLKDGLKKGKTSKKVTKVGIKSRRVDHVQEEEEDDDELLPDYGSLALHNVSAGEEDANQGTEDTLARFRGLSLHTSPEMSGKFVPKQLVQKNLFFQQKVMQKKSRSKHPSYIDMITNAIQSIDSRKGISIVLIKKWIIATYPEIYISTMNTSMKKAITKGMDNGTFKRPTGYDSLGASLAGSIMMGSAKKGIVPKPKIRKPTQKKNESSSSSEKAKFENAAVEANTDDDETSEDKEKKSPVKIVKKKPVAVKIPKLKDSNKPAKGKKATQTVGTTDKPLTKIAEKKNGKPTLKKKGSSPSSEEAKLDEANTDDYVPTSRIASKAKVPKTTPEQTTSKARVKKAVKKATPVEMDDEQDDETSEDKENKSPVKIAKKKPVAVKIPKLKDSNKPAKGKKATQTVGTTDKPLTRSDEKQAGMSLRTRAATH